MGINNENKVTVYWVDGSNLHVEIDGNVEIINALDAYIKYGSNEEFLRKYNSLMNLQKKKDEDDYVFDDENINEIIYADEDMKVNTNMYEHNDFYRSDDMNDLDKFFDGVFDTNNEDKVNKTSDTKFSEFEAIYDKLVNELTYDEDYAAAKKKLEFEANLSAYEMIQKSILRTKEDKRGVCTDFTYRMQDELDKLGIENYPIGMVSPNGLIHWANLYVDDNNYYVCDITRDLIFSDMMKSGHIPSVSIKIPLEEYIDSNINSIFRVPEKIKDDGRIFDELRFFPLDMFIALRDNSRNQNEDKEKFIR